MATADPTPTAEPRPSAELVAPQDPAWTGTRVIRATFRRERVRLVASTLFLSLHQLCETLVPVAIGLVVDRAVSTHSVTAIVVGVVGIFALFAVLTFAFRTGFWFARRAQLYETDELRRQILGRYLRPGGISTTRRSGEILAISTNDAEVSSRVMLTVTRAIATTVAIVASAVVLISIDLVLGLVIMIGVPLVALGLNALGPRITRSSAARQQALGGAAALGTDLLRGLRPLRGIGGERAAAARYARASEQALGATVGAARAIGAFQGLTIFSGGVLVALVAGCAGWFALGGRITIGELITIVGLGQFVAEPVTGLAGCVFAYAGSKASAERVAELLSAPLGTPGGDQVLRAGELRLDDVSAPGLTRLSLAAPAGTIVGVACDRAATATALSDLLSGRIRPTAGEVSVDGVPIASADPDSRHRVVLVEPHQVDLFGADLRQAVTPDDRPVEDGEAVHALGLAGAADLSGGAGLDRALVDRGLDLSGGQRQRVALARSLLARRPVLVLHDPTTAVDAVTEQLIAEQLRSARPAPETTVLITTSPALLNRCDRVWFCPADGPARSGRHHDLLEHDPHYAAAVVR